MADIFNMTDTWNDGATTFTAIKMNVTDTASEAASLLMDLQVGGASKFSVSKAGVLHVNPGAGATGLSEIKMGDRGAILRMYGTYYGQQPLIVLAVGGLSLQQNTSKLTFGATSDLVLERDAADILAQRRSTNPQAFRLYNTYTDASNYERGFMQWSSNVLQIGTEFAGTGTQRNLLISGGDTAPSGFIMQNGVAINYRSLGFNPGAPGASGMNAGLYAGAANVLELFGNSSGVGGAFELKEMTAPSAPSSNRVRIYAEDNGAGKTRLMALFATGAAQQIAIEP